MKAAGKWRCLVCGYLAGGDERPEVCPVCGAAGGQFVSSSGELGGFAVDIVKTFDPHPVAAHFSNSLIPVTVLLLAAWEFTGEQSFEAAAFYCLVVGALSLPVSLVSGYLDWKRRYGGLKLPVFKVKLILSTIVSVLGAVAVALRLAAGQPTPAYYVTLAAMLALVVVLGHFGAKLVFYWKKELKNPRS